MKSYIIIHILTKDDNMTGDLIDRQDYEKRKQKSPFDISTILNNHGYNMQKKRESRKQLFSNRYSYKR